MTTLPVQQQSQGNAGNQNYLIDKIGGGFGTALDVLIWKGLTQLSDGQVGLTYDPFSGQTKMNGEKTMGGDGLTSLWKATDMFWIAGGAVVVLGIYFARK